GGRALRAPARRPAALLASGGAAATGVAPGARMTVRTGAAPPAATAPAGPRAARGSPAAAGSPTPATPPRRQLITVTAASYGTTYATLTAYRRTGHGWWRGFRPWAPPNRRHAVAPP